MFKAIKEFFMGKPVQKETIVPVPYKTEAPVVTETVVGSGSILIKETEVVVEAAPAPTLVVEAVKPVVATKPKKTTKATPKTASVKKTAPPKKTSVDTKSTNRGRKPKPKV